jgi:inorganic phosphate transporter, PiT family
VTLALLVALALAFDFMNGFHDAANSIATVVSTGVLRPHYAVVWAAFFNFVAIFIFHLKVAATVGKGIVDPAEIDHYMIFGALSGAIIWNLITWYYGLPSSSSQALIGGLLGATLIAAGTSAFNVQGIVDKVLIPMVTSPIIGFFVALVFVTILLWLFFRAPRRGITTVFRRLQVVSAGFMAFSHGSNDAQKTMGIITLALFSAGLISTTDVPTWVIIVSATAISLGTAVGGWRIMYTMGHRVVKLEPVDGFAAETTAATVIIGAASLGMPVSTTHVISSAIMGVGSARGLRSVRWGVARRIVAAWIITIPASGIMAAAVWFALNFLGLA